jgi:peptide deformylase
MIQTMYAAPGIGLAATQVGVGCGMFVCDISSGETLADLLTFINPEFVERDGMQLEEEGLPQRAGIQCDARAPIRAVVKG